KHALACFVKSWSTLEMTFCPKKLQLQSQRKPIAWAKLIGRCLVSCVMVLLSQFAMSLVPRFFSASPFLIQFSLSALLLVLVLGLGGWCRRLLGIHASAPAFIFFTVLFIWFFYVTVIRQAVSVIMDAFFNGEVAMLLIGLCSILKSDPGLERYGCSDKPELDAHEELELSPSGLCHESTEGSDLGRRVRYCKSCKAYIRGFDHHCPAFGNCIGQKNRLLFVVLLVGFLITEASYLACSSEYTARLQINKIRLETSLSGNLAVSTAIFSILQLSWQVLFLTWHVYCVFFDIRTEEWVNWKKYPEFQIFVESQPGQSSTEMRFANPYDKGILQNLKEFVSLR
ncbi:hypothetical protein UlMin_013462, partial [Ulmus minor]